MRFVKVRKSLTLRRKPAALILSNPSSWDILDHDWNDEVGWTDNAVGTYNAVVENSLLKTTAGDSIVDADYISKVKSVAMLPNNDYTLQTKFKIITGWTTFATDYH